MGCKYSTEDKNLSVTDRINNEYRCIPHALEIKLMVENASFDGISKKLIREDVKLITQWAKDGLELHQYHFYQDNFFVCYGLVLGSSDEQLIKYINSCRCFCKNFVHAIYAAASIHVIDRYEEIRPPTCRCGKCETCIDKIGYYYYKHRICELREEFRQVQKTEAKKILDVKLNKDVASVILSYL